MSFSLHTSIALKLKNFRNFIFSYPAIKVSLWLSCIPLVLPAPAISGAIATAKLLNRDKDKLWWFILLLSVINFSLSFFVISWLYSTFGFWFIEKIKDLFYLLFRWFWPSFESPSFNV